jgi:hypothetical protein
MKVGEQPNKRLRPKQFLFMTLLGHWACSGRFHFYSSVMCHLSIYVFKAETSGQRFAHDTSNLVFLIKNYIFCFKKIKNKYAYSQ